MDDHPNVSAQEDVSGYKQPRQPGTPPLPNPAGPAPYVNSIVRMLALIND